MVNRHADLNQTCGATRLEHPRGIRYALRREEFKQIMQPHQQQNSKAAMTELPQVTGRDGESSYLSTATQTNRLATTT
jgi:hypothetical protein